MANDSTVFPVSDIISSDNIKRCGWAKSLSMRKYHDLEWGRPASNDSFLFEILILETLQAGISWSIVLSKRENYRKALFNFDFNRISPSDRSLIEELMKNPGLIRNIRKTQSIVNNAKSFKKIVAEFGSFLEYLKQFKPKQCIVPEDDSLVPCESPESRKLSADMRSHGFTFVGPKICYSYMQAVGIINDHVKGCFIGDIIRSGSILQNENFTESKYY